MFVRRQSRQDFAFFFCNSLKQELLTNSDSIIIITIYYKFIIYQLLQKKRQKLQLTQNAHFCCIIKLQKTKRFSASIKCERTKPMISVSNVSKSFGKSQIIKDISFVAEAGKITGLIGANGSGKTTTMRLISTILKPDCGTILVDGVDAMKDPAAARKNLGVLFGGDVSLYNRLSAWENIMYFAKLQGMSDEEAEKRIKVLSNLLDMDSYLFKRVTGFSRGMRQKVSFAKSIVHNPSVILLDEPSTGLDIYSIRDVQDFILTCKEQGKTVLVSTHNMHEIERLCDNLVIIADGRIIRDGTKEEILKNEGTDDVMEMFFKIAEGSN